MPLSGTLSSFNSDMDRFVDILPHLDISILRRELVFALTATVVGAECLGTGLGALDGGGCVSESVSSQIVHAVVAQADTAVTQASNAGETERQALRPAAT